MRIGVLGTGLMGTPMARNLMRAGFDVAVWNRTPAKADGLVAEGAVRAADPAACARGADILLCMLADGAVVAETLFARGAAAALAPGALVLDMSSIGVSEARAHAQRLGEAGIDHVDAPVSGGTVGAESGSLAIMAGCSEAAFERLRPVFAPLGRAVRVGQSGAGQIAKLANQMIVGVTIGAVAEALVFAERAGADPGAVREALRGGFADSRILELHGARMIARDFAARGKASTQIKDLENAIAAGSGAGAPMPFTALGLDLFRALLAEEGDVDHSGLWLTLDARTGA
jgi:2-hydroxy-3-oxopropionate reductase